MPSAHDVLRVPAHPRELARVRRRVEAWAGAAGLDAREADALRLAVDEASANAIEHGLAHAPGRTLTLRRTVLTAGLAVSVRYIGPPFDPTTVDPPDPLPARARHGYGLRLIRRLVDEVTYRYTARTEAEGVNELRLVKRPTAGI